MNLISRRSVFSIVILGITSILFVHFYIPRFITEVENPVLNILRGRYNISEYFGDDDQYAGKSILIDHDSITLSAYVTYASVDSAKGTIILLHGIRSHKEHFVPIAKMLAEKGFHSVCLDLRAHGESTGKFCTFGVKEKNDIQAVIDYIVNHEQINSNIGIWGQSLGAAVALQTMAIDDRIKYGIIESTFSEFRITAHDYARYHLGFNISFLTNYLIDRAGKISDFDPDDAVPKKYCESIKQKVLVVHGDQDQRINIEYGMENYENIPSKQKAFLNIHGASHLDVWEVGGERYLQKVMAFIEGE